MSTEPGQAVHTENDLHALEEEAPRRSPEGTEALLPAVAPAVAEAGDVARTPAQGTGYQPGFLGTRLDAPALAAALADDAVVVDGSALVPYTHFSLTMSRARRFARWVAWNVDGTSLAKLPRNRMVFRRDPRLPEDAQVGDELYSGNRLDRGHLARRSDLLWGPLPEANAANSDSFYFTNIAPQIEDFNQSRQQGLWGRLEDALYEDVEVERLRISVAAGPVLGDADPVYRGVALPREYWKAIAYVTAGELRTRAFLLTQGLDRLEVLDLDEFRVYETGLPALTKRTGVEFPGWPTADERQTAAATSHRRPLETLADIRW